MVCGRCLLDFYVHEAYMRRTMIPLSWCKHFDSVIGVIDIRGLGVLYFKPCSLGGTGALGM